MSAIGQSTCQLADVACICASNTVNYMSEGCIRSECTVKESLSMRFLSTLPDQGGPGC